MHSAQSTTESHGFAEPIRVALVDDHQMTRQGLRRMREDMGGLVIVGEARDGVQAVGMAGRCVPDVVIMDVNLPAMSGIEATRRIVEARPQTLVIGVSFGQNEYAVNEMKSAGSVAWVSKEHSLEKLYLTIIETVQTRKTTKAGRH